ncbi:bifunctional DNA-formamidopyrimidine glycosylase/DNA-(apurinic or apyrimidinic site) lyase [Chitinimonas sp. BJB300]|uniref:bifunctional DNA-formamidopyrimidine glycosylase/DNA-(apurinic or apyrimidinic site) lyase n=1 Tax=Chitinimonas sp. BJB300 TaxID=1559339 RepID=UPI000C0E7F38|nr:bifunctional DNA-formamidopyrimidine glycosylase/DNA-(apurinic or apyrimidinic site) lyase [Chitinimonas sp. BJB300]PHV12721.1 formamidopyrimidine-DNA glycosylase [Chitinimonas sp. BJB300]TSJ90901.1 bifunctional DNA-formamidopyrimidine glycosylase/DNA-(apurinic or apyrimidinic site) lyase [Chitinimonas sp. BJB300]
MPELPEVETTRRGIEAAIVGHTLQKALVRNSSLRWPVPPDLSDIVAGRRVVQVLRRAKYLLFDIEHGHLILHLGMSGSLRVVSADLPAEKHDHLDLVFSNHSERRALRYRDPRRFGAVLWQPGELFSHPLLHRLGPEPLGSEFTAIYLFTALRGKRSAIKLTLMDSQIVVGVGNIYANEALFRSGIAPNRPAGELTLLECERLAGVIRTTLLEAIAAGGSTLQDFVDSDGKPGYFQQSYFVYGRAGQPCLRCGTEIRQTRLGQRSTWWCARCQPG